MERVNEAIEFAKNYLRIRADHTIQFVEGFQKSTVEGQIEPLIETATGNFLSANIFIKKLVNIDKMILNIFHEFIHLQQLQSGRLAYAGKSVLFMDKDVTNVTYWQQPHEVEARMMSRDMLVSFNRFMREKMVEIKK